MKTKNKPVEITTAIVGAIVTAAHIAAAVYLILQLADPDLWGAQTPGIFLSIFTFAAKIFVVMIAVAVIAVAILVLVLEILPLFVKSTRALRVIAIITSSMLAVITFIEFIIFIGNAVRGFRDGNYGTAMLISLYLLLAIGWFALNVTKAVIYKNKE